MNMPATITLQDGTIIEVHPERRQCIECGGDVYRYRFDDTTWNEGSGDSLWCDRCAE